MNEIEREMFRTEHQNFCEELAFFYKYTNRNFFNLEVSKAMLESLLEMNKRLLEKIKKE